MTPDASSHARILAAVNISDLRKLSLGEGYGEVSHQIEDNPLILCRDQHRRDPNHLTSVIEQPAARVPKESWDLHYHCALAVAIRIASDIAETELVSQTSGVAPYVDLIPLSWT